MTFWGILAKHFNLTIKSDWVLIIVNIGCLGVLMFPAYPSWVFGVVIFNFVFVMVSSHMSGYLTGQKELLERLEDEIRSK